MPRFTLKMYSKSVAPAIAVATAARKNATYRAGDRTEVRAQTMTAAAKSAKQTAVFAFIEIKDGITDLRKEDPTIQPMSTPVATTRMATQRTTDTRWE